MTKYNRAYFQANNYGVKEGRLAPIVRSVATATPILPYYIHCIGGSSDTIDPADYTTLGAVISDKDGNVEAINDTFGTVTVDSIPLLSWTPPEDIIDTPGSYTIQFTLEKGGAKSYSFPIQWRVEDALI